MSHPSRSFTSSTLLAILCLLALHSILSPGQPHSVGAMSQYESLRDPNKVVNVCGRRLALMMSMVCNGKYNYLGKRNIVAFEDSDAPLPDFYPGIQFDSNARTRFSRQSSEAGVDNPRVMKKGIYDECCRESCKLSEMFAYCAENP